MTELFRQSREDGEEAGKFKKRADEDLLQLNNS